MYRFFFEHYSSTIKLRTTTVVCYIILNYTRYPRIDVFDILNFDCFFFFDVEENAGFLNDIGKRQRIYTCFPPDLVIKSNHCRLLCVIHAPMLHHL